MKFEREPENAEGPFYVKKGQCLRCCAPLDHAADMMDMSNGGKDTPPVYSHCYFKKQPSTADEIERAVQACAAGCIAAQRYAGNDPDILKRMTELGRKFLCDALDDGA